MASTVLERALIAGPTQLARGLVAPLQLQLTASDRLRVNYNASDQPVPAPFLQLNYRILTPEGGIVVGQEAIAMVQDFQMHAVDLALRDGFLLALVVRCVGNATYGSVFVSVYVYSFQGAGFDVGVSSDLILAPLLQGFPTGQAALTWPGSLFVNAGEAAWLQRTIIVPDPVAGANWLVTVGAGREWEVLSVTAKLTTSAVVADRLAAVVMVDAAAVQIWNSSRSAAITASSAVRLTWAVNTPHANTITTDTLVDGLPNIFRLQPNEQVSGVALNMQAADQWSGIRLRVRERLNLA